MVRIFKDRNSRVIEVGDFILVEGNKVCQVVLDKNILIFEELRWNYINLKLEFKDEAFYPQSYGSNEIEVINYNAAVNLLRGRL